MHDRAAGLYFDEPHFDRHLAFAFVGLAGEEIAGRAFSVPFAFRIEGRTELPDAGWDEVIRWSHQDHAAGRKPTALSALEISLLPPFRGRSHPERFIATMKDAARAHGFADLYAPVRPSLKHRSPRAPMAAYAAALRPDGLPVDPWLRTHVRLGGRIVKVAPCSMTIVGTLAEWSRWTGLAFPTSGDMEVPGALAPVLISREQDCGVYVEPNVWVHHRA